MRGSEIGASPSGSSSQQIQPKANQVIAFIHSFIDQKSGAWLPKSWDSVLARMNALGERSWVHV